MKIPYFLKFEDENLIPLHQYSQLPDWCKYPLHFALERRYFKQPQIELISQQLNQEPFFIDLVQINAKEPAYIPFDINDRQLYLYFMLKGRLLYTTGDYRPIIRTQPNTFLMSYYDIGHYFAYAPQGMHIAFVVSILPEWIESMYQEYDNLKDILHRFKNENKTYDTMYQCRMDRKIHRWLYKIYSYSQANIGAIDGNLRKYISYLLEHYDQVIREQNGDLAYKIKAYIEEHYCDAGLSVKFLTDYFFLTERTLLNVFKRQYNMSVQEFYTELRMGHALLLMQQKGIGIKDVYMEVGYTDERTFRSALERYLKRR
ncbi:helix-turn-helix domain-containing protein [Chitinophaga sp. 212800010-3]|uniref:AraC family transcriptional regulator n=1 Tax=Bacteroidota TaxID=976 RepID=UPI001ACE7BC3|nr:helix-turn-helix domain-containing protein [Chitinophaga sp. 212800010-3]MBN8880603.1 helix-turn-helix transcriptional regulator [Sphingobacteriales bacterium]MEC5143553.1 HTH araC/xylS-type domain-containing protein [Chitinophaga sp. 212800010-3]